MQKKTEIECPLRKLREITGKSQVAFARVLGCSSSTIKKIEAGESSKLNLQLVMATPMVFGVEPRSLVPPSTHPVKLEDGKPYTKEFFEKWWNISPEERKRRIQPQKLLMLKELELLVAAAIRLPGMAVGAVITSFHLWAQETMTHHNLFPHYDAEWNERVKRAKKKSNKIQSDLELVQLFRENKAKFILKVFEGDDSPTISLATRLEMAERLKEESDQDWKKKSKQEKLTSAANVFTKTARMVVQAGTATNSTPNRKR
jgi:transcriptional regulator with XRE-family HTH domain